MEDFRQQSTSSHSAFRQPEILPPDSGSTGQPASGWYPPPDQQHTPPPAQRQKRAGWAFAPATYILVGINCAVFILMVLTGSSIWSPTSDQILFWGANNGTLVLHYSQWWRLITAMFVHIGIIHIATNMWCLWNLGLLAEPLMGPAGVFAAYLLTGFAGNLLSIAVHPGVPGGPPAEIGAGASGAVFGLAGVLIVLLKSPRLPIPQFELKKLRRSVIYFALINLAIGLYTAVGPSPIRIDNMAHLGGFLSGLALGVPLVPKIGSPKSLFERRSWLGIGGAAFILILLAFGVHSFWH
jgi:rhomboid protease GluP